MKKEEVGMLYLGLHRQLIKKFGTNAMVTRKEFFCKLGKHYLIPKELRHFIVDEMADRRLIEKVNRDNIKILNYKYAMEQ
jgi:hypothetical protein